MPMAYPHQFPVLEPSPWAIATPTMSRVVRRQLGPADPNLKSSMSDNGEISLIVLTQGFLLGLRQGLG